MTNPHSYENWTREELIARLNRLESKAAKAAPKASTSKPFNFASHPRRKVALKFCYAGWNYNGLTIQDGPTPLPTVEGVLFDALAATRLIDPAAGMEGCGWERCGRTDRGVSGAGQVVSLWVRSALGNKDQVSNSSTVDDDAEQIMEEALPSQTPLKTQTEGEFDLIGDLEYSPPPRIQATSELRYVSIINRVLPPSIRMVAWSPVSPSFSARFACRYRHYKYFFTPSGLDLSAMTDAAHRLLGEHDFRNLCKLDPGKQITNFHRKVLKASLSPTSQARDVYVFDLIGTAFLYHQVRHIMAILFLVGTGLEQPSVMSALLNVNQSAPYPSARDGEEPPEVVERKPDYQMADALPLVLWECGYDDAEVQWRTDDYAPDETAAIGGNADLYHQLHSIYARSLIHTTLESHFLAAASQHHSPPPDHLPLTLELLGRATTRADIDKLGTLNIPLGGGTFKRTAKYVPLLRRKRLDSVEAANERWRVGKGGRRDARREAAAAAGPVEDDGDE